MTSIPKISGLNYVPNIIAEPESLALLETIDMRSWRADLKRRVQHYGYIYDYRARAISDDMKLGDLPKWLDALAAKLFKLGIFAIKPDQVIVNEYEPGQGISPHIDCVPCFGNVVASLSLGSAVNMNFRKNGVSHDLRLTPNSLLVLEGDARLNWQHGIPARKSDLVDGVRVPRSRRVSLTFRTVKLDA